NRDVRSMFPWVRHMRLPFEPHRLVLLTASDLLANGQPFPWQLTSTVDPIGAPLTVSASTEVYPGPETKLQCMLAFSVPKNCTGRFAGFAWPPAKFASPL